MTKTNLQLTASELTMKLRPGFGFTDNIPYSHHIDPKIANLLFQEDNITEYFFDEEAVMNTVSKLYWVEELENDIIITTAPYSHQSLQKNGVFKGAFGFNLMLNEIDAIFTHFKNKAGNKTLHMISPRIETGRLEDHIVIEYRKQSISDEQASKFIIDSKKSHLLGDKHHDVARMHTQKQDLSNISECGYHVMKTVTMLRAMIAGRQAINPATVSDAIANEGSQYIMDVAKSKLLQLKSIYEGRKATNQKHTTFKLLKFGHLPSLKFSAVKKILDNIDNEDPVLNNLSPDEKNAALKGELGKAVKQYYDAKIELNNMLQIK